MNKKMDQIQIVLVEPKTSANIGAICRAMKTMGIHKLAIIGSTIYDTLKIKNLAVNAFDIYEKSQRFNDLNSALINSVLIAGTTRRNGKKRKFITHTPEELSKKIADINQGEISIIFGRETNGLTVKELAQCNISVTIPSSRESPSLNLAQAVQVICYSIYTANNSEKNFKPVTKTRMDNVINSVINSLDQINFFKKNEKKETEVFLTDVFMRAGVSETETRRIERIFLKIAGIVQNRDIN